MVWTDGPERWHRLLTLLRRLERLVDACAQDEELDERERERVKKLYTRLHLSIAAEAEREQQRLLDLANGD